MRLVSLICGILFGIGLALSDMTDTRKVIGFLNVFGQWDSDLLWVMASAVLTTMISFRFILKRKKPVLSDMFTLPKNNQVIDVKLLSGAVVFGVGWGIFGYCPGPAIAALVYLQPVTFLFLFALITGMFIGDKLSHSYIFKVKREKGFYDA
jgi:uncharacterized membrane protein YedE/YeeE